MATTGETVWASLIARQRTIYNSQDVVRGCYLTFSFGRYIRFRTPLVPLRDFRFSKVVYDVPSRIKPGIYLHFVFKRRLGLLRVEEKFKISWPYLVRALEKGAFRYTFPYGPGTILAALQPHVSSRWFGLRNVILNNPSFLKRPGVGKALTPAQLFNLSLIAGTLAPRGQKARSVSTRTRGPYFRKLKFLRPSPEVRNEQFTSALEIYPNPYSSSVVEKEVFRRTWTGTTTPGFGSKKMRQLPVNGHTVSIVRTDRSYGFDLRRTFASPNTTYNNGWGPDYYFGLVSTSQPILITETQFSDVANAAIKKLNANANVGVQANMAQNIAQYRQTTNMIALAATRISGSMFALRKGQFSRAANILVEGRPADNRIRKGIPSRSKSLANNWLELQYGWKPILSDVQQSMQGLANYMVGSTSSQAVKGVANLVRENSLPISGPVDGAKPPVGVVKYSSQWTCRYGVEYRTTNHQLSYLSQLGFTNPVNLLWEIIPYSFVVDWFIPIGPYLESMSAPHGLEFLRGYKTLFGRRYISASSGYGGKMPGALTSEFRCSGEKFETSVILDRSKLSAWPVQSFPTFKNPFSTTHALNAIALLRQAFGRR